MFLIIVKNLVESVSHHLPCKKQTSQNPFLKVQLFHFHFPYREKALLTVYSCSQRRRHTYQQLGDMSVTGVNLSLELWCNFLMCFSCFDFNVIKTVTLKTPTRKAAYSLLFARSHHGVRTSRVWKRPLFKPLV